MLAAAMGTGSQSSQMRYPGVSQRGPGVPPDDQFVPSSTLKVWPFFSQMLTPHAGKRGLRRDARFYANEFVHRMEYHLEVRKYGGERHVCRTGGVVHFRRYILPVMYLWRSHGFSAAIPRKRGGINLKVRFTEIKERKQHILLLFNTLTAVFDDDGNARQLKFATDTRTSMPFIGRSGPTDFVEAAFDFVGYR